MSKSCFQVNKVLVLKNEFPTIGSHSDIAVFYKRQKCCVIEIDGPVHYYPDNITLKPKSQFKQYLLQLEWPKVISVPTELFRKCPTKAGKIEYLKGLIKLEELLKSEIKDNAGSAAASPVHSLKAPVKSVLSAAAKPFKSNLSAAAKPFMPSFLAAATPVQQPSINNASNGNKGNWASKVKQTQF